MNRYTIWFNDGTECSVRGDKIEEKGGDLCISHPDIPGTYAHFFRGSAIKAYTTELNAPRPNGRRATK